MIALIGSLIYPMLEEELLIFFMVLPVLLTEIGALVLLHLRKSMKISLLPMIVFRCGAWSERIDKVYFRMMVITIQRAILLRLTRAFRTTSKRHFVCLRGFSLWICLFVSKVKNLKIEPILTLAQIWSEKLLSLWIVILKTERKFKLMKA